MSRPGKRPAEISCTHLTHDEDLLEQVIEALREAGFYSRYAERVRLPAMVSNRYGVHRHGQRRQRARHGGHGNERQHFLRRESQHTRVKANVAVVEDRAENNGSRPEMDQLREEERILERSHSFVDKKQT